MEKYAEISGRRNVPVKVDLERGFAFIEFPTPDDTTMALKLDGIVFQGQMIKVHRPREYAGGEEEQPYVPGVVGSVVADSPNKIFIGGLPAHLNDEQVMSLLTTFGELKSFNLVKVGVTNISKVSPLWLRNLTSTHHLQGFAFCEYVDHKLTDIAVESLNGIQIGDKTLNVQRASASTTGPAESSLVPDLKLLTATPEDAQTTNILLMLNMVTADDLIDDRDYKEIVEDIRSECGSFGTITDVRIPRPQRADKKWNAAKIGNLKSDADLGVGRVCSYFLPKVSF